MSTCPTLTIATYNICHGRYARFDWTRLTAPIRESGADIVGIQEVDMFTTRSQRVDSVSALAKASGLPFTLFVATMPFEGGHYGTAILSRFPILSDMVVPLKSASFEPRALGCVQLRMPDGLPLTFLNTHLSHESVDCRRAQMEAINAWMESHIPTDAPFILTGDFNTEDDEDFRPLTASRCVAVNQNRRFRTFRIDPIAIDNILYAPTRLRLMEAGIIDSDASDHNLLFSRFERT